MKIYKTEYLFKRVPLTREEEQKLISACKDFKEKLILIGMLETGMRLKEFANLKKDNFLWQENKILIDGKGGPYGKMSKKRFIPLSNKARQVFESWFTLNDNIPWSTRTIQRIIKRIAQRAGMTRNIHPHIFRHTFCVRCLEKGIDSRIVQKIAGHSSILITMRYLNIQDDSVIKSFLDKW